MIAEPVEAVGRAGGAGLGGVCENGQRKALHVLQSGHKPNSLLDGNMASSSRLRSERGERAGLTSFHRLATAREPATVPKWLEKSI